MRRWSVLYASHHFALHTSNALCILLTSLFLLLGGITGPQTGYWWLTVTYLGLGDGVAEVWDIGGLGSCLVGEK